MLLTELVGVKSLKHLSASQVLKHIKTESGVTMVRGVYGIVLAHPSWDYVLKIFPKDDCYLHFLEFCKKNKSPHLPVIKKGPIKLTPFFNDKNGTPVKDLIEKYHAVKIEKLEAFPSTGELHNAAFIACNDTAFREEVKKTKKKDVNALLDAYSEAYKSSYATDLKKYKSFIELIIKVTDLVDTGKCKPDMHPGNLMMRGTTPVIVDPYTAKEKTGMSMMKLISKMDLNDLTSIS